MKRRMNTVCAVIAFVSFFGLLAAPSAFGDFRGNCNNGSLNGSFGFTLTGSRTDTNPGARAAVGQLTLDGNGNLTGSETQSNNGTIVTGVTEAGTYTVNSDCSGSATLTLNKGDTTTRHFNFEILNSSRYSSGAEEVFAIVTDTGRIETIDFKQQ
jgi:hypothetical protein